MQSYIFVGNSKKGPLLVRFLTEKAHLQPKKILFVDDKKGNVDSVESSLTELKNKNLWEFEATSYRYSALDKKVAAFRSDIADVQYKFLFEPLSDVAAQAVLSAGITASR